ncbi:hypothetical protein BU24DRAFT_242617 [Aaosphaeria arxii CBS 175.79]|uniref:Uncharacterized protein n=1 Tax=Aaosphaeria arxii CBS 175.79 TaxID=1450172 RepID=A0A6A5XK62_9PLEO|nr:uncharacterized protein BU24DRAFT_242617 [Aaosphaeria arxii CBS 175.79]KAF2013668.1 hypothetical protein BU24DRAFT_242617 [Aaosphaeria arxii CBS 175.79]
MSLRRLLLFGVMSFFIAIIIPKALGRIHVLKFLGRRFVSLSLNRSLLLSDPLLHVCCSLFIVVMYGFHFRMHPSSLFYCLSIIFVNCLLFLIVMFGAYSRIYLSSIFLGLSRSSMFAAHREVTFGARFRNHTSSLSFEGPNSPCLLLTVLCYDGWCSLSRSFVVALLFTRQNKLTHVTISWLPNQHHPPTSHVNTSTSLLT